VSLRGVLWICDCCSRQIASAQEVSRNLRGPFVRVPPNTAKNIREKVCLGDRKMVWSKEPRPDGSPDNLGRSRPLSIELFQRTRDEPGGRLGG